MRFKHKGLEKFFTKGVKSEIQAKHAERLRLILGRLKCFYECQRYGVARSKPARAERQSEGGLGLLKSAATGVLHSGLRASTRRMSSMKTTIKKLTNMRMHNPPHPGEVIRKLCLEPLGYNPMVCKPKQK